MFKALKIVGVFGLVLGVVVEGAYGWAATKSIAEIDKELIKYGLRLTKNRVALETADGELREFKPFIVTPIDNKDKTEKED